MRHPGMPPERGFGHSAPAHDRPRSPKRWPVVAVRWAVLVALSAWVPPAPAAGPSAATNLTLATAIEVALRDNAELKSARARWEAMQERPNQAKALPNPMLSYGGMDMADGGDWPDTGEMRFMVQQDFPWFGKRGLREGMAWKDAQVMRYELEAMTREVVMMVKENYSDLVAVQRVAAITREEEQVLRRMEKAAETLYATGERGQGDVLKAQAEVTMLKQKLLELLAQETTLKAKLNGLLNRRADAALDLLEAPVDAAPGDDGELPFAAAAARRPEVLAARAQAERYELERQLMAKESLPDYKLGLEYRDVAAGDDMVMFTVSVELPVWRSKYQSGVREAEKMRDASEAARAAAERRSEFDVQDAAFKLQTARRTLALYRTELVPQADARFRASEAGYRAGKVDFTDLLESERFLLEAKTMAAMAEGSVGMLAARLERAVGVDTGDRRAGWEEKP